VLPAKERGGGTKKGGTIVNAGRLTRKDVSRSAIPKEFNSVEPSVLPRKRGGAIRTKVERNRQAVQGPQKRSLCQGEARAKKTARAVVDAKKEGEGEENGLPNAKKTVWQSILDHWQQRTRRNAVSSEERKGRNLAGAEKGGQEGVREKGDPAEKAATIREKLALSVEDLLRK